MIMSDLWKIILIDPINRYIVIQTNKETRWWVIDDGLLSGLDRPKHAGLWNKLDERIHFINS